MSHSKEHKFDYTDENIFEHALNKIGMGHLVHKPNSELTTDEKEDLDILREEYARLKGIHLKHAHHKRKGHSKHKKLEPISKDLEAAMGIGMWFYAPHDLHSWGATHVFEEYTGHDGRKMVKLNTPESINCPDGEVIYLAQSGGVIGIEDASHEAIDCLFRDFCTQAAAICGLKPELIRVLQNHYDDIKDRYHEKVEAEVIPVAAPIQSHAPGHPGHTTSASGHNISPNYTQSSYPQSHGYAPPWQTALVQHMLGGIK